MKAEVVNQVTFKIGNELHRIDRDGIIKVYDANGSMIRIILARPGQIAAYYNREHRKMPPSMDSVMECCAKRELQGSNATIKC